MPQITGSGKVISEVASGGLYAAAGSKAAVARRHRLTESNNPMAFDVSLGTLNPARSRSLFRLSP